MQRALLTFDLSRRHVPVVTDVVGSLSPVRRLATFTQHGLIDYSDLGDTTRLDALMAFLGSFAAGDDLFSDLKKQFNRPFWDGIKNASKVRGFLAKSEWAHLLPELD